MSLDSVSSGAGMVINIPNTTTTVTINTQNVTLINTTTTTTAAAATTTTSQVAADHTPPPTLTPTPITNLANLLPTGTVLVFQAITPLLFSGLLAALAVSLIAAFCFLSSFTDSFTDPTNPTIIHYGIATTNGLLLLQWDDQDTPKPDLSKFRLCFGDFVHAVVSLFVFLAIAFSDTHVQFRFFPNSSHNDKQIMTNLPLAAWVFANFLFTLMPSTRRGIGFANSPCADEHNPMSTPRPETKILTSMGNLANLLPTGTVLAFQALTPSFSNNGHCDISNRHFTACAIALNAVICFVSCFTDSVAEDGRLYLGLATPKGLYICSSCGRSNEMKHKYLGMDKYRMRRQDWVHAFVSLFVLLSIAFSSGEVHRCYFPEAVEERRLLATFLPVGASIFAGCLFTFVPTRRRGVGYSDTAPNKT